MRRHSPLTPFIAHAIQKMAEIGVTNVLKKRHIEPKPNCKPVRSKGTPLGMEKFASLFALYSISCLVSLIILVMENIYKPSIFDKTIDERTIEKLGTIKKEIQLLSDDDIVSLQLRCEVKRILEDIDMLIRLEKIKLHKKKCF